MFRRRRFADLISRQLDLFEQEHADLIQECLDAEEAYNQADRDEAEFNRAVVKRLPRFGLEIENR